MEHESDVLVCEQETDAMEDCEYLLTKPAFSIGDILEQIVQAEQDLKLGSGNNYDL